MTDVKDGGTASEAASPPATGPKPEGFIDVIRPTALNGWAWIPEHPEVKVKLEVVSNGVVVGFTTADKYREDLKERGLGDGHHAFEWLFESAVARMDSNNITVRFAENKEVLGGSKDNNAAVKLGLLDTKVDQLARQNHRRELVMAQLSQRFLQLEKTLKAQAAQQDSLHGQIVESPRGESADPTALHEGAALLGQDPTADKRASQVSGRPPQLALPAAFDNSGRLGGRTAVGLPSAGTAALECDRPRKRRLTPPRRCDASASRRITARSGAAKERPVALFLAEGRIEATGEWREEVVDHRAFAQGNHRLHRHARVELIHLVFFQILRVQAQGCGIEGL